MPFHTLERFLQSHDLHSQPLLLALSGGADSLCLFYCLIEYREKYALQFHVAHVDHGWRESSEEEAYLLQQLAYQYQVPFHLKKLDPSTFKGNLEEFCRNARYAFFEEVCKYHGLQALVLGHHEDDKIETILKRVLEGAHWSHLNGLKSDTKLFEMRILRPFLSIQKKDILKWLQERQYTPFEDSTNSDTRFLRARMRHSLLPWLDQEFGKKVGEPLRRLGEDAEELVSYFDDKIKGLWNLIVEGPFGLSIDFGQKLPTSLVEMKYFVRRLCEKENICLPRSSIHLAAEFLLQGVANRLIEVGNRQLWIDRKRLFLPSFSTREKISFEPIPLVEGQYFQERWFIEVKKNIDPQEQICYSSWKEGWKGKFRAVIPKGSYRLAHPRPNASYQFRQCSISKWWNDHKIPAFFRGIVPVILQGEAVYHEFLTGNCSSLKVIDQEKLEISLHYKGIEVH